MNKRRLLKLADLLEADAKNKKGIKFDLSIVAKRADDGAIEHEKELKLDCGTTACAIGLWGLSRKFKGVTTVVERGQLWPYYGGRYGIEAAQSYFGITPDQSERLFLKHYYTGPTTGARGERAVAAKIRKLVNTGSP